MDINIHLYLSTYVCIYLYVLKTMSSFQCLQFHSSAIGSLFFFFFCICSPFSYREKPVSHSFCHSTHGHPVYITTATAVAKTVQRPLYPTLCRGLSPSPTGQLPSSAPHNAFWDELGTDGGDLQYPSVGEAHTTVT